MIKNKFLLNFFSFGHFKIIFKLSIYKKSSNCKFIKEHILCGNGNLFLTSCWNVFQKHMNLEITIKAKFHKFKSVMKNNAEPKVLLV